MMSRGAAAAGQLCSCSPATAQRVLPQEQVCYLRQGIRPGNSLLRAAERGPRACNCCMQPPPACV